MSEYRMKASAGRTWFPWLCVGLVLSLLSAACAVDADDEFASNREVAESNEGGGGPDPVPDPDCDNGDDDGVGGDARPSFRPDDGALTDPFPAGSHMAAIRDRGGLRAGIAFDTLLFGYLNPNTNVIEGFDIDVARLVANSIFGNDDPGNLELVPILSADRIPFLQDDKIDIVVKTMTITCERWGQIDFSTVYFESGQQVLLRNDAAVTDITEMNGERLCAASGTTSLDRLKDFPVEAVDVPGWTDCLVKFQQGEIDGISTDDTILAGLAEQDPYAVVTAYDPPLSEEPYGIGVSDDHPEFTRYINAVLERARDDGTWQEFYDRWLLETLGERTPPPASYR